MTRLVLQWHAVEFVARDLIDRGGPGQDHGVVEALADHFQRRRDAGFPHRGETVEIGSTDQTAARAIRQRLENVVAGPHKGDTFTLSVSLLRVGVTSELRLEMQRDPKTGVWQVADSLG